jgi:predicted dehydrogenase
MHIAIIGTGGVARQSYIPFLRRQEGLRLSYYNRTRDKAEACAAEFGGTVAGSIAELLSAGPDAVLVLSSEKARHELAMEALRHRPRRIFFEKPLTARDGQFAVGEDDFTRGAEILAAAAAAGSETAMVFNYRFFDQVIEARRLISERNLGAPIVATALVHRCCWSHCIDLLGLLAGPAQRITALPAAKPAADGSLPLAAAFTTAAGASGTIVRAGIEFFHPLYELTIGFERGRLHLRGLDGDLELVDYRSNRHERLSPSHDESQWKAYDRSFERSLAGYLASIRSGEPPPVPGRAGLEELRFEAGLARSAATGSTVDLISAFPIPNDTGTKP